MDTKPKSLLEGLLELLGKNWGSGVGWQVILATTWEFSRMMQTEECRVERTVTCLIPLLGHLEPIVITAKICLWTFQLDESNTSGLKPICFGVLSLANQSVLADMMVEGVFGRSL